MGFECHVHKAVIREGKLGLRQKNMIFLGGFNYEMPNVNLKKRFKLLILLYG